VGASNSGFTDPLQMAAISLVVATHSILLSARSWIIWSSFRILEMLSEEIGPLAQALERETLEVARRSGDGGIQFRIGRLQLTIWLSW
jgi:hypothetical protein